MEFRGRYIDKAVAWKSRNSFSSVKRSGGLSKLCNTNNKDNQLHTTVTVY